MPISRLVMEFVISDLASGAVKRMTENLRHMGKEGEQASKAFERMADNLSRGVKAAGLTREIGSSILMPGMKSAGGMDASLRRLQANMDAGMLASASKVMEQSRRVAADIAGPTPFSPQQVIDEAITEQLKAGMGLQDILGGSAKAAAYLATSEGTDIGTANSAILAMATTFELSGDGLERAADLLVRASGASEASAASLQEGLANTTSGRRLGLSPEDTIAMLATLHKGGRKGSAGGTALEAFLSSLGSADKKAKLGIFQGGEFGGTDLLLTQIRSYFGAMSTQKRGIVGEKLFGREGMPALEAFLRTDSTGSFESMKAGMEGAMGLEQKMGIVGAGHDVSWEAVRGTAEDAMATAFEPLLKPSKSLADGLNSAAGATGNWLKNSPLANKMVSQAAVGAVALPAIYSAVSFISAAGSGLKGLRLAKGLGSLGSLGGGIATGKALEVAAGVQPVFVVNMPGTGIGVPGAPGVGPAIGGGAPQSAGSWWAKNGWKGANSVQMSANSVTLAAASLMLGWELGTMINEKYIKNKPAQAYVEAAIGTAALSPFTVPGLALRGASALGVEGATDILTAARDAQARIGLRDYQPRPSGIKIDIYVDAQGEPTVVTEGVDHVEVASSRAGVP